MTQELEVKIKEIILRTYNVKSFRLDMPEVLDVKAGQFLNVTLGDDPKLKRYLSISNSPTEAGYLEFTKKLTPSDFSGALDTLNPGDLVKVQYPFGKFTLDDPQAKIAFLSGGIGITPIRSITKFVVDKNLGTDMVLVYSNRSLKDIVFREDFDSMQKVYPKLKVAHVLGEAEPGFKCTVGYINAGIIKNEVPDYMARIFYLCGPPAMVDSMKNILTEELKVVKENIITENFQGY